MSNSGQQCQRLTRLGFKKQPPPYNVHDEQGIQNTIINYSLKSLFFLSNVSWVLFLNLLMHNEPITSTVPVS